jgi:hypothetical protein
MTSNGGFPAGSAAGAQNGIPANGSGAGGSPVSGGPVNGSLANGGPVSGSAASGSGNNGGYGFPGASQPGFGAAPGQAQQYYGSPGQDLQAREAYGPQSYGPGPSIQQYQAQQQPMSVLPAVRTPQPVAISLPDAVKAAHGEGFSFGESVGRDAPGLWLEAVLARKPRMPSDLEARLLQGSLLPIDSLLHDEVRHSLRRGFWDALESARR